MTRNLIQFAIILAMTLGLASCAVQVGLMVMGVEP